MTTTAEKTLAFTAIPAQLRAWYFILPSEDYDRAILANRPVLGMLTIENADGEVVVRPGVMQGLEVVSVERALDHDGVALVAIEESGKTPSDGWVREVAAKAGIAWPPE